MRIDWFPLCLFTVVAIVIARECICSYEEKERDNKAFAAYLATQHGDSVWTGRRPQQIPYFTDTGALVQYGYELIANTAAYLGPEGSIAKLSNGMNCQNCHLQGGVVPFGNNFGKVFATYPQYRARNNGIQDIPQRITDCFERSLNGHAPDTGSREMKAITAYIRWLGDGVPKGMKPPGTSIMKLPYLHRSADVRQGERIYREQCSSCHGKDGEGVESKVVKGYSYPPLWGEHSYNDGAGLYRLSNFAGFVYNNMPYGTDYHRPKLSVEESWDVAAFVNSRPRPHFNQQHDWQLVAGKPVDYPFKPYADTFTEYQHKFGPFQPIKEEQRKQLVTR
ncbi:c-type cytochrome [Chitinophaga sp. Mgbs1]|uniref:C-type cytochrome n=2 Tax=Chitinophaga solisilvae TaxID=1233460 RepID=A0A3S1CTU4_9BACT|nr:c-type cytochrome [Chitinophaga solisilvae]